MIKQSCSINWNMSCRTKFNSSHKRRTRWALYTLGLRTILPKVISCKPTQLVSRGKQEISRMCLTTSNAEYQMNSWKTLSSFRADSLTNGKWSVFTLRRTEHSILSQETLSIRISWYQTSASRRRRMTSLQPTHGHTSTSRETISIQSKCDTHHFEEISGTFWKCN